MGVIAAIVRVILKLPRILWKWATPRNGWKQVVTSSSVGLVTIPKELAITIDEVEHLQKKKNTFWWTKPSLVLSVRGEVWCMSCGPMLPGCSGWRWVGDPRGPVTHRGMAALRSSRWRLPKGWGRCLSGCYLSTVKVSGGCCSWEGAKREGGK